MLTRRQLIFGRTGAGLLVNPDAPHHKGAMQPAFAESCLPSRGVVCRSCGEACETAAISFRPAPRGMSLPVLDAERCTGCGDCVAICPVGALALRAAETTSATAAKQIPEELPA